MTWNHRVMRHYDEEHDHTSYSIREVFYDDDGTITGWTAEPMDPYGETPEELRQSLEWMLASTDKPVLDEAELLAAMKAPDQTG